jgi:hypothetical protein
MKYLIGGSFVVIALAVTASVFVFQVEQIERKNLTAEVPAEIPEMLPRKTIDPETGQTNRVLNVLVIYRYSINGENFEKQTTVNKTESLAFRVGEAAKICFNPENKDQAELFPIEHNCGK